MATAQEAVKRAITEHVVPALRANGFKGTWPTWRRANVAEDAAVVNVQLSQWNTRDKALFYVNLAVAPRPWREWDAARMSRSLRKSVQENDGLWRQRLRPSADADSAGGWVVGDDASADAAARDVLKRLQTDGVLQRLVQMLDRDSMIETVRAGDLGEIQRAFGYDIYFETALAVLLADQGQSRELDEVMASLLDRPAEVDSWPRQRDLLVEWVRSRTSQ